MPYLNTPKGRNACYGDINTQVTVVETSHHPVMIVEREDGFRFSARFDELSEEPVIIEELKNNKK